jgi:hypothetical protein
MRVSPEEWTAGSLGRDKVELLLAEFDRRGLFVLEGVFPLAMLQHLAPRMLSDSAAIVAHGGRDARGDFGHGHLQLGQPRVAPFVHADVVANPIVEQCVLAILRSDARLGFVNGNCAMPNSGTQLLHMDDQWDWASVRVAAECGEAWPHRTTSVHVNLCPTEDVTAENGATEVTAAVSDSCDALICCHTQICVNYGLLFISGLARIASLLHRGRRTELAHHARPHRGPARQVPAQPQRVPEGGRLLP